MWEIKDTLLYSETHEWIKIEGEAGIIGITDFAQEQLGNIIHVELPKIGKNIFINKSFGSIESAKTISELNAPVNGTIIDVNNKLSASPELINEDPYIKGWMIKIKITDKNQIKNLKSPGAYKDITGT